LYALLELGTVLQVTGPTQIKGFLHRTQILNWNRREWQLQTLTNLQNVSFSLTCIN